ncbi:FixH family protein [Gramella sp. KN1008]|uniref:FixH family protein n=1 Tax=Gramella sp. KN1008 TaxID=2529298 RepID=UPI0010396033|nr:FixH family protein [Gramella sp. KN1008]TBW28013.1 cytochrome C oxidase Cbb3 [Gramella sp. KN1008]
MKFNWATGLVIGMVAFVSFIMYFVVTMISSNEYDHDLVVEDYYKAELHYQQDIDAEKNALNLEENISLERHEGELVLIFPESMNLKEMKGHILFYRPSNKTLDFEIPLSEVKSRNFVIPNDNLVEGRWNVSVNWTTQSKEYLFKKEIIF